MPRSRRIVAWSQRAQAGHGRQAAPQQLARGTRQARESRRSNPQPSRPTSRPAREDRVPRLRGRRSPFGSGLAALRDRGKPIFLRTSGPCQEPQRRTPLDHPVVSAIHRNLRAGRLRKQRGRTSPPPSQQHRRCVSRSRARCSSCTRPRSCRSGRAREPSTSWSRRPYRTPRSGWITFTRIPSRPHSSAATRASCVKAAFDAE